jgi:hypothetical protein
VRAVGHGTWGNWGKNTRRPAVRIARDSKGSGIGRAASIASQQQPDALLTAVSQNCYFVWEPGATGTPSKSLSQYLSGIP